jgi:hypothetical protein
MQSTAAAVTAETAKLWASPAGAWEAAVLQVSQAAVVEAVQAVTPDEVVGTRQALFSMQQTAEKALKFVGVLSSITEDDEETAANDDCGSSDTQLPPSGPLDNSGENSTVPASSICDPHCQKQSVALANEQTVAEDNKTAGETSVPCGTQPSLSENSDNSVRELMGTPSTMCSFPVSPPTSPREPQTARGVIVAATSTKPAGAAPCEATSSGDNGLLTPPKNEGIRTRLFFADPSITLARGTSISTPNSTTHAGAQTLAKSLANPNGGSPASVGANTNPRTDCMLGYGSRPLAASAILRAASPYDDTEYQQAKARMRRLADGPVNSTAGPSSLQQLDATEETQIQSPEKRSAEFYEESPLAKKTRMDACDQKLPTVEATGAIPEVTTSPKRKCEDEQEDTDTSKKARMDEYDQKLPTVAATGTIPAVASPKRKREEDELQSTSKIARFDWGGQESPSLVGDSLDGSFDGAFDEMPPYRRKRPQMGQGRPPY